MFYVVIMIICFSIAIFWYFYVATAEETYMFAPRIFLAFFHIGFGFVFFYSKFPEKQFKKSRFVQLYLQSHIIWHIFVFLNGYCLYWCLYDFLIHV